MTTASFPTAGVPAPAPVTYKILVAGHLQAALDAHGYTHQQLATALGLKNGNYVSMLISPRYPTALLSPSRIPALASVCRLSAPQRLALLHRRVKDHPDNPLRLSAEVFRMLVHSVVEAVDAQRAARRAGKGSSNGS